MGVSGKDRAMPNYSEVGQSMFESRRGLLDVAVQGRVLDFIAVSVILDVRGDCLLGPSSRKRSTCPGSWPFPY